MASTEAFESTLKEVVRAKRLSASKVKELTEIAMKTMKNDTQLVSILYRTHKSLSPASKIHSLYTFDALARAARSYTTKHSQTGDLNTEPGNCATFLLKVEGVLDGLFRDMLRTDHPDAKEKTKKVLDIWVKGHTFPSDVMSRLQKLFTEAVKEPTKERSPSSTATADPRLAAAPAISPPQATAPPASTTPPVVSPSSAQAVQSQLFAMLSQVVAATGNGQTPANIAAGPAASAAAAAAQLDSRQLALFQQLTQVASAGNAAVPAPQPVPVPSLVPSAAPANAVPVAPPYGGPSQSLPYRDESNGFAAPRETQYDNKYTSGPQQQRGRDFYDHRRDPRGDFRGPPRDGYKNDPRGDHRSEPYGGDFRGGPRGGLRGGFRGRGRGRWDERDQHLNRSRENKWDTPQGKNPQSRSRSPVARNGNRPHSPQRDRARSPLRHPPPTAAVVSAAGKDEFGRDIRPSSPDAAAPAPAAKPHVPELSPHPSEPAPIPTLSTTETVPFIEAIPTITGAPIPTLDDAVQAGSGGGLETFDWTTFDMSAPSSWEALGKAWNVSNGYMPAQEELWQYVHMLTASMNGAAYSMGGQYGMPNQQWGAQEQNWGHNESWRGRGRGRGRGYGDSYGHGYGYEGGRGGTRGRGRGFDQNTDALTLAGGDDTPSAYEVQQDSQGWQDEELHTTQQPSDEDDGSIGGRGGRMQKVGDRWVFVKADAS